MAQRVISPEQVQPGDLCVVNTGTRHVSAAIVWAEKIVDGVTSRWDHVVICSRKDTDGWPITVEAQPGGAVERRFHYDGRPHLWSTGILAACPLAGPAAQNYIGVGYSDLDYVAIAAHTWHLPLGGQLRDYVASTGHMICSQLADQARLDGGSHLFRDGRWPGYVKPSDIGHLLGA